MLQWGSKTPAPGQTCCCQLICQPVFWYSMPTCDICTSELLLSDVEHVRELVPHHDIGLDEDCARLSGILLDELLRLRTKTKIRDHYVAVVLQQQLGEAVVDPYNVSEPSLSVFAAGASDIPEPAPVTMADFPFTEKAADLTRSDMMHKCLF